MDEKKKKEEDQEDRRLDAGEVTESVDEMIDRLLSKSDKKKRRYVLG